jgi:hypothetical protein
MKKSEHPRVEEYLDTNELD